MDDKRFLNLKATILGVVFLLTGYVGNASALVTSYTNEALWQTAAGGTIVTEDFADAALVPGLTITFGQNSPPGGIGGGVYSDVALTQVNNAKNPKLNFSPATTAFGADFDLTPGGAGDGILFTLLSAGVNVGSAFLGNPGTTAYIGFFGFVSDTAFDTFRMDAGTLTGEETFNMDNARFRVEGNGGPGPGPGGEPVPEPGTILLLGVGLAGIAFARKRIKG